MTKIDDLLYEDKYWDKALEKLKDKNTKDFGVKLDSVYERRSDIAKAIIKGEYKFGIPIKYEIKKPGKKPRIVYIFTPEERLIHGVLYRILSDVFRNKIEDNCFSYKANTTTAHAIRYIMNSDRNISYKYSVKLDISSYFNSVNKETINSKIDELFKGYHETATYKLIKQIYSINTCKYHGKKIEEYMSLIPGTSLSNLLGNFCLAEIDRHFKEIGVTYARYADDIILFDDSQEKIQSHITYILDNIKEMGLTINKDKYVYYNPEDVVEFLGLSICNGEIDISNESFVKMKKKIKHACNQAKNQVVFNGKSRNDAVRSVIKEFNQRVYKCYIIDKTKYGWGYYAFRFINTDKTIRKIDFYLRDRLRQLYTGRNNSANIKKLPDEQLKKLGYVSMVNMYKNFKQDFDVYCTLVDLM